VSEETSWIVLTHALGSWRRRARPGWCTVTCIRATCFHPGNVLRSDGECAVVAIDPRPCWGDRAFDAADLIAAVDLPTS
jgi:hypothetical protein